MNLVDLFDGSFRNRRNIEALEFRGQRFTFGDINERSNRLARLLAGRGLKANDRLCVYMPNSVEMIDLFLACLKLGVIFVPLNILYREREIVHILSDAKPAATVAAVETLPGASSIWHPQELSDAASHLDSTRPVAPIEEDTPASLIYTSGTTGASKGAVLSHNNFVANAENLIACWQVSHADRLLLALPLFHVHGLCNGLHVWLASGCKMRLLERFERKSAAEQFLDFRPTLFYGVPTIYARLLETPAEQAGAIGRFMRLFVSGSAPLSARVFDNFRKLFGHEILERYGMTETLMNTSNPYKGERRPGTVGQPLPGVSVRLLDREGQPVPDGETGELHISGPNVFDGYWNREAATRESFVNGYFRTGDLAVRSHDGYYTLRGRSHDLIISAGFNIYPREVEEFLEEQVSIAEAAVIGIPDEMRGELPVAFIVPCGELDRTELENACRSSMASFKVPRAFVILDKLPRNALGKVQKHLLPEVGI
jgi:malonyl-CoA/methylmalonyl-CoA synthetase